MTAYTLSGNFKPERRAPVAARTSAPSLAAALVTAAAALSVVLADHYLSDLTDGHVVAAWLLMWAVVFGAFIATRMPARLLANRIKSGLDQYAGGAAQRRADRRFMEMAISDPRIMAELQAAQLRAEESSAYAEALAPMGMEAPVVSAPAFKEAFPTEVYYRGRNIRLYYI
jgi:hypothetical protein